MNDYPKVSIIFPNYNGGNEPLECLASIQKLTYPKAKIETIVIDNGSTDGSDHQIKKEFPKAKLIKNPKNIGFAKATNLGIKKAHGKYIFVTNNDVVLEKKCLKNLIEYLISNPKVGVVGPITYFKYQPKKIAAGALKYNFYTGLFKSNQSHQTEQEADWASGCGMLFTKKLWRKLGGFDENFFFIGEDLDFCLRAKYLGFRVIYYPKAAIWHSDGATVNRPEFLYLKYFEGYKSKLRLILKHGSPLQILASFLLQFAVFAPYRTLILREKSFIPLLEALFWNLRNLPKTFAARRKLNNQI